MTDNSKQNDKNDPILESCYSSAPFSTKTSYPSICHLILSKAEEHARNGIRKWITNAITGEEIDFADIEPMSRKVANTLKLKGMRKGDIVIYLTANVTAIYTVILGVWRLGGCVHSSYSQDTKDTLLHRVLATGAKWIFCDIVSVDQCLAASADVPWPFEIFVFGQVEGCTSVDTIFEPEFPLETSSNPKGYSWEENIVHTEVDDSVLILCSSGTTGKSKGVVYTNRNLLEFYLAVEHKSRGSSPFLYILRSTQVLGLFYPLRNILAGEWAITMHILDKEQIFNAIRTYKPFLVFGAPFSLLSIVQDPGADKLDKSCIEFVCSGGLVLKPITYEALRRLPNLKAVINGYGMTECGVIATPVDYSSPSFRVVQGLPPLSVGKLYPNTSLKILDLDTGKALGPNANGEVTIRSRLLCSGYFKNDEENSKTFCNGWFRTGDVGYYDENGFIFITGRIKDNFKYLNNHISSEELEDVFLKHEAVAEACVFGTPVDGGEVPRAAVVLKSGYSITSKELQTFVNDKVASYKYIRGGVYFVPYLPRGNTGKTLRAVVAAHGQV